MKEHLAVLLLASIPAVAQYPVEASRIPGIEQSFASAPQSPTMRCTFQPIPPALDFALRQETGYTLRFPKGEFDTAAHSLEVAVRITSPNSPAPLFLTNQQTLPAGIDPHNYLEMSGRFLIESGDYRIEALASDDAGRTCRGDWKIAVKPPPTPPQLKSKGRVTLILDAAPANRQMVTLQPADIAVLSGTLSSLVRNITAPAIRMIAINVDTSRELTRIEPFTTPDLKSLSQLLTNVQLATVSAKAISSPVAFLTRLIETEIADKSALVIFIGPHPRADQAFSKDAFTPRAQHLPVFYYLEYRQPHPLTAADFPATLYAKDLIHDSIERLMEKLNGHTLIFSTPEEFARTLERLH